jgi:hypothetical protein
MRYDRSSTLGAIVTCIIIASCGGKSLNLGSDSTGGSRYAGPDLVEGGLSDDTVATVAAHQYGGLALAVDAQRIYWSTGYGGSPVLSELATETAVVRSCRKTDCAGTLVTYATDQWGADHLVVDRDRVYWPISNAPNPSSIVSCPIAGCVGPPSPVVTGISPTDFAIDETSVYWLSTDSTLLKCPLTGCQGAPTLITFLDTTATAIGSLWFFQNLAFSDKDIFFISTTPQSKTPAVMSVPKDGSSPPRIIADHLHAPTSLAVDGTGVYWTEAYSVGTVRSCPLAGCSGEPTTLASDQHYPVLIALDRSAVYWFTIDAPNLAPGLATPGTLHHCSISGCDSNSGTAARDQSGPMALAVDADYVYWTTFGEEKHGELGVYNDGAVSRARKNR